MRQLEIVDLPLRNDDAGAGYYGAPRGNRTHKGIDFECTPGRQVLSPVAGKVTKHGYPYGDDLEWRYIQITDHCGEHHRLFYVEPTAKVGAVVAADQIVGTAQDIRQRYPNQGMKPHIHYEVMNDAGECRNPAGDV